MRTPKVHTVVNLLIHNREGNILMARRSLKRRRHPGVVSSITAEITHSEAKQLLGCPVPTAPGAHWFANQRAFSLIKYNFAGRLLLDKIFARKLAPAGAVREGRIFGGCQVKHVLVKDVGDPLGQDGTRSSAPA